MDEIHLPISKIYIPVTLDFRSTLKTVNIAEYNATYILLKSSIVLFFYLV